MQSLAHCDLAFLNQFKGSVTLKLYKVGTLPVISRVITCIRRVITPVIQFITPFIVVITPVLWAGGKR